MRKSRQVGVGAMARLLLADRVKDRENSFLAPLIPTLEQHYDVRFLSSGPGPVLAEAIEWADIVWLEWCWDHAVWATASDCLAGKRCVVRLHSIEALQTDFPSRMDWSRVDRLITVGDDIAAVLKHQVTDTVAMVIPNGIDMDRFRPAQGDRYRVGWAGHLEPKKNPMLLLQIARTLHQIDPRFTFHVAGGFTDLRTARYIKHLMHQLGLAGIIHFDGFVSNMPEWYADKGVVLSTSMYESFGMSIGEAMAVGAFPVIHDFPGANLLWPRDCLFASIDQAIALIRSARIGLFRAWVAERYGLDRQIAAVLRLLAELA